MSQSLEEFRKTYRPPDRGIYRVMCPGLARLDLRMLAEQFHIPGDEHLYNHREHKKYPAAYVSGRLWGRAEVERQWVYGRLMEAGYIGVEVYFPTEAYKGKDPFYWNVDEEALTGKSLAFLLACNLCVRVSEAGAFSLAEQALATWLGIPVVASGEFCRETKIKKIGQGEVCKLMEDDRSVLEHIDRLGLREKLTRPFTMEEEKILGQDTFWGFIRRFFDTGSALVWTDWDFVKYRLRDMFGRDSFPIFRTLKPEDADFRLGIGEIDGQTKTVQMFDFDDSCNWFWYLDEDKKPIFCERIGKTTKFRTVPNAVWEDNG